MLDLCMLLTLSLRDVVLSSHFADSRSTHATQPSKVMIFFFYYVLKDLTPMNMVKGGVK